MNSRHQTTKDKVVVITGASSGLGRSLALGAGALQARVALLARNAEKLTEVAKLVEQKGGQALAVPVDITLPEALENAFKTIIQHWSRIDLLFNNAGVVEPVKPLERIPSQELMNSLTVNVFGVYLATREALRLMQQHGTGTIVNISSGAAEKPYIGWSMYGSQKAAVNMFTRIVAEEMAETAVRILAISPGPFESPMQETLRQSDPENFPAVHKFTDLHQSGKLPHSEQIADIILDISLSHWPELSGRIVDIRDPEFQKECQKRDIITINGK